MQRCKKYRQTPGATQHNQGPQMADCRQCVYFSQANCGAHQMPGYVAGGGPGLADVASV